MLSTLSKYSNKNNVFILGSGYSINHISNDCWDKMRNHVTIAFNWFCFHDFEPSIYIAREQANIKKRQNNKETVNAFIKRIKKYKDTSVIVSDISKHSPKAYLYKDNKYIKSINPDILRDIKTKKTLTENQLEAKLMKNAFTSKECFHGDKETACTLANALHIAASLNPNNIILLGVDLNDSRYFWMNKKETRHTVKKKGQTCKSKHATYKRALRLANCINKTKFNLISGSEHSLLNQIVQYRKIESLL
ncbi:hypothetical protein CMI47_04905 [Candidatus Pacearchaeota archaeon]|nr:hypothetical protein [Candidatus Pacearchaeota archaeon]|tara:strand:- start:1035 stop:1781 length:747 start_codon:yes stop_codon:yes gene_type:complete